MAPNDPISRIKSNMNQITSRQSSRQVTSRQTWQPSNDSERAVLDTVSASGELAGQHALPQDVATDTFAEGYSKGSL